MRQRLVSGILAGACALVAAACGKHSQPNTIYMPDMVYSPSLKAQEAAWVTRGPVPGTVSRDFQPYAYARDPEGAAKELRNPIRRTKAVLARGQVIYGQYCLVCHGPGGEGDGTVVPQFPRPPSLLSEKIRGFSDGRIYHIVQMGQNLMPSYASQIDPADRWAAIHYVRALQRAKQPTPDDLKVAAKKER